LVARNAASNLSISTGSAIVMRSLDKIVILLKNPLRISSYQPKSGVKSDYFKA